MTCTACGGPTAEGVYLCGADALELEYALAEVPAAATALEDATPRVTLTANYGERTSSGSKTAPAPVNIAALDAKHGLQTWLMVQALKLGEKFEDMTSGGLADHLRTHVEQPSGALRRMAWAGELKDRLRGLLQAAEHATNTAKERQYAGNCVQDGAALYATNGSNIATCTTCGTSYTDVQNWRKQAVQDAKAIDDEVIGYPNALAQRLARVHNATITPEYIRCLAAEGYLKRANQERGDDGKELRAMYRLGDVKAAMMREEAA